MTKIKSENFLFEKEIVNEVYDYINMFIPSYEINIEDPDRFPGSIHLPWATLKIKLGLTKPTIEFLLGINPDRTEFVCFEWQNYQDADRMAFDMTDPNFSPKVIAEAIIKYLSGGNRG